MWIGKVIRNPAVARLRAEAGAAYLDANHGPGWDRMIDVERLDIGTFGCVLGQLMFQGKVCLLSPRRAVQYGFTCGVLMDVVVLLTHIPLIGRLLPLAEVARSYDLLTQAWRDVLMERRQQLQGRHLLVTTSRANPESYGSGFSKPWRRSQRTSHGPTRRDRHRRRAFADNVARR